MWEVYINPNKRDRILVSDIELKRAAQKIPRTRKMKPGFKGSNTRRINGSHVFLAYRVLDESTLEVLSARYVKGRGKRKGW